MKIGRLLGADLRVHWLFPALFAIFAFRAAVEGSAEGGPGAWTAMGRSMGFLGLLFVSVFLHEVGHVIAGNRAGGRAHQILLWPLGGLAEIEGVPRHPTAHMRVSASGPLINLTLAVALLGVLVLLGIPPFSFEPHFGRYLLQAAFFGNAVLFGFNVLPVFPLDGGNFLRWALIARRPDRGFATATLAAVKAGKVTSVILGVAGLAFFMAGKHVHPLLGENAILMVVAGVIFFLFCERERRLLEYGVSESPWSTLPGSDLEYTPLPPSRPGLIARWKKRRLMRRRERDVRREVEVRKRVDFLLDKIAREGLTALSEREKAFLKDASKRYQKDGAPK